ncbi:15,16-dihydrobiliverdin:ferredoxin oxidoreductase [Porphyridium purpureum]|uniref:15,16-dihydrobiliverdin:ferredoxin oxidoreductase n=1 Tax=Porphyridium purpureum TaxID=35688 RepID=A0A5J4YL15_PORPP|nr:15,16-dihydrobiliverdin:ferredoxin oxidoreductase [Porphyridium purpureum]UEC50258.1 ferredoxin-dependent bilin reductase [Porphyridium purpureum]|eukprot:POR4986..scf244_11
MGTVAFLVNFVGSGRETRVPRLAAGGVRSCAARRAVAIRRCHAFELHASAASAGTIETSSVREKELPYERSIAGEEFELLFMPFVLHQNKVMRDTFQVSDLPFDDELAFQSSTKKAARIESWCYKTPEFRKIRSTYIDAGIQAQVFNSVWYPDPKYDLPLLGIDFLSFGKKKVICIMDFQPLTQDAAYLEKYISPLAPVKAKYKSLAGEMSAKFYDENVFFSKQLAFGRFDNAGPVMEELFPAFKEYLDVYFEHMQSATPTSDPEQIALNLQRQKDYDQYSAERDPAIGLFSTYFGPEWAEKFTHEFLFEHSVPVPPKK